MKSEIGSNFQKKIKDYVISYCPTEYLGKSIHGEMRTGYRSKENKIVIFRIAPLPLTPLLTEFLQLQQQYSDLSGFARVTYEPLHSSSNHYVPLEYFPKTFHSERALFKANPKYMDEYVEKFLRVYAFFYNMRIPHGNLTAHNIGTPANNQASRSRAGSSSWTSPPVPGCSRRALLRTSRTLSWSSA